MGKIKVGSMRLIKACYQYEGEGEGERHGSGTGGVTNGRAGEMGPLPRHCCHCCVGKMME